MIFTATVPTLNISYTVQLYPEPSAVIFTYSVLTFAILTHRTRSSAFIADT